MKVVNSMLFKGRTVAAFMLLAMALSVVVTLSVTDRLAHSEGGETTLAPASGVLQPKKGLSEKEIGKLNAVMDLIETKYYRGVERGKLMNGAIQGMMEALGDPYSVYMDKDVAERFSETIEGSFSGIGAEVTMKDGKVTVQSAIKASPADRAGIQPNDVLISVNSEKLEGLNLNEAVAKIRGPKGTKVNLVIQRAGVSKPIHLAIVRDDVDYETVYAHLRDDAIGVIEIRQFSLNTGNRFIEELGKLEKQGMKGLIIDVRNNPGGVLPVVELIAQPFVPEGKTIVQVEDRTGQRKKTISNGKGKPYPIAVLVNKGSASASEVLAGALKEVANAVLIGETTFGKGTVQVSYDKPLGDGSLVKMTVAKWLTPLGNWVNEKGLKPDVEIPPPDYYTVARLSKAKTLVRDSIDEDVRSLQIMLAGLGYKVDRKDGYFSETTERSVKEFQKKSGLPATGKANKTTALKLEEKVVQKIRSGDDDVQLLKAVSVLKEKLGTAD